MIRTLAATLLTLSLTACAPTERDEADQRALAEARPVGAPADCIDLARIDHSRVRDDRTIDFAMKGGKVYRNILPQACSGLRFEESFSYRTSLSQLCSTDLITVNRSGGIDGPTCGLGRFQPVEIAGR
jgi:Family of unknown function (DUF6491)